MDTFCDIPRRRGVRGAKYAFANSKRLQARLMQMGIQYHHILELAPTAEIREYQKTADIKAKTSKRKRLGLDDSFIDAYTKEVLDSFNSEAFLQHLGKRARVIALFCVEREPEACHRSLVAKNFRRI